MTAEVLRRAIQTLGVTPDSLGVSFYLQSLESLEAFGRSDPALERTISERVADAARELSERALLTPRLDTSRGDIRCLLLEGGSPAGFSFRPEGENRVGHGLVTGPTGYGKTVLLGLIAASHVRAGGQVFAITANPSLLGVPGLEGCRWVLSRDLKLNPWECPESCDPSLWDDRVNETLGRNLDLRYGVLELNHACSRIREGGVTPTLRSILAYLQDRKSRSFSRRNQYKDSVILNLQSLGVTTGGAVSDRGLDPQELFSQSTILVFDFEPRTNALLQNLLLTWTSLLRSANSSHLLFLVDEAQAIADDRTVSSLILQLRHSNTSWLGAYQNMSAVPREIIGNVDFLVSFRATQENDRRATSKTMNLSRDAEGSLFGLEPQEVIAFLPRSSWPLPFRARVQDANISQVDRTELSDRSPKAATELNPSPSPTIQADQAPPAPTPDRSGVQDAMARFLHDVGTRAHEFSPLGPRWERCGIRSAELQQRVLKEARSKGLVLTQDLAVGRGRPQKLVGLTDKGFQEVGLTPWKTGRGSLRTRAATHHARTRLEAQFESVVPEGLIAGKQVDLVATKNGRVLAVEIAGNPDHEAHNALTIHDSAAALVVVAVDKQVLDAVKKRLAPHELKEVHVKTLAQVLSKNWNWPCS